MADAKLIIPHIKKWEGGYSNNPYDAGGCTMMGITIGTFRNWFGKNKTCEDLKKITEEQWLKIFKYNYWDKIKGDYIINQSLAKLCVDMCWMSGTITAIKKIQTALGLKADGIVGPITLAALNSNPKEAFFTLWSMRKSWLEAIARKGNNKIFLKGWLNRLNDCKFE